MKKVETKQDVLNVEKFYKISEEQLVGLYSLTMSSNALEMQLGKVKKKGGYSKEYKMALEYYLENDNESFKSKYDKLKALCKKDEYVAFIYVPFSLQRMLGRVKAKINGCKNYNDKTDYDDDFYYDYYDDDYEEDESRITDVEACTLEILHDIISINL